MTQENERCHKHLFLISGEDPIAWTYSTNLGYRDNNFEIRISERSFGLQVSFFVSLSVDF
jgi:hypothetical protein